MSKKLLRRIAPPSDDDDVIDDLESRFARAADEAADFFAMPAEEAARYRRENGRLARAVCDRLRAESHARRSVNARSGELATHKGGHAEDAR